MDSGHAINQPFRLLSLEGLHICKFLRLAVVTKRYKTNIIRHFFSGQTAASEIEFIFLNKSEKQWKS